MVVLVEEGRGRLWESSLKGRGVDSPQEWMGSQFGTRASPCRLAHASWLGRDGGCSEGDVYINFFGFALFGCLD